MAEENSNPRIKEEFHQLASALNTAPAFFADVFGVDPALLMTLLEKRHQIEEDETLTEALVRNYGEYIADMCLSLVGVCPYISKKEKENVKEKDI